MTKYVLKRFVMFLVVWFAITSIAFIGSRAAMLQIHAFDHPFIDDIKWAFQEYKVYLRLIVEENWWGTNYILGQELTQIAQERVPISLKLNFYALILYVPLGIFLGVISARHNKKWFEKLISSVTLILGGIPSYIMMFFFVMYFGYELEWFPARWDPNPDGVIMFLKSIAMPVVALALVPLSSTIRIVKAELLEELQSEYVLLLRTKGLSERQIVTRHALRNSVIPVAQDMANHFGIIVTMSFIIEMTYNVQGIGYLFYLSMIVPHIDGSYFFIDHETVTMIALTYSGIILFVSFLSDVFLALLDPRINIRGKKV